MRWIHLAIIILIAAATIIVALQKFEIVTISLLRFNARVPLALLIAIACDGRQLVRAAAPIVRRFKAQGSGVAITMVSPSSPTNPGRAVG